MARYTVDRNSIIEELKRNLQSLHQKCKKEIDGEIYMCSRSSIEDYCHVYAFPKEKWRNGNCPMADVELKENMIQDKKQKVRVGQQKQKRK